MPNGQESIGAAGAGPALSPGETAVDFLQWLDPDGVHNLVEFYTDGREHPVKSSKTFAPGAWGEIRDWVDERAGKSNLYYTVNEVRADFRGPSPKPKKVDIRHIRALYVDVDPQEGKDLGAARSAIRRRLESFDSPGFSAVVDSGGGYQGLIVLAEKIAATPEAVEWAETHGRGLGQEVGSDTVQSGEHLLRLPGPDNIPTPAKRRIGRTQRPASVVSQAGPRVTPEEITRAITPQQAPSGAGDDKAIQEAIEEIEHSGFDCCTSFAELPEELKTRFDRDLKVDSYLARVWNDGKLSSSDKSGSAHRAALSGALKLLGGYSAVDYAHLAYVCDWAVQRGHDRDSKLTPRALGRDWVRIGAPNDPRDKDPGEFFPPIEPSEPGQDVATGAVGAHWAEPVDLFSEAPPVQLSAPPAGALSPELERWVESESRRKGVSPAFAAAAAIATIAGAVGKGLKIRPRLKDTGWCVPCSLWLALVDNPGGGKSPIISAALKPLRELDGARWAAAKPELDKWDAANRGRKKTGTPRPLVARTLVDDVTMEKLVMLSAENPRGLLQAPDELTQAFGQFGAYKSNGGGGDRSQYLRFYDGGSISVDRVGAGARHTESALMGILAGTQPDRIGRMVRDLGEDGLLQRFLFIQGDEIDRAGGEDLEPDTQALRDYQELVRFLAVTDFGGAEVRLSADAFQEFERAGQTIRELMHLPGASVAWQGHVAKWPGTLARLVLTFHAVELWRCYRTIGVLGTDCPVDRSTVLRAVAFGKFLLRHSLAFYGRHCDPAPEAKETRNFAGYLLAHPELDEFGRRDAGQAQKALRDKRLLPVAMKNLETMGWIMAVDRDSDGPCRWRVNPAVRTRFAERSV